MVLKTWSIALLLFYTDLRIAPAAAKPLPIQTADRFLKQEPAVQGFSLIAEKALLKNYDAQTVGLYLKGWMLTTTMYAVLPPKQTRGRYQTIFDR